MWLVLYEMNIEQHPDPNLVGIYIQSNINKVLSSDGSNFYFRKNYKKPWILTKGWSLVMNEILYGNKNHATYYIMDYHEYILKYCVYKKTNIGTIPIYVTYRSKL